MMIKMTLILVILFEFSSLAAPPISEAVKTEKIETLIKHINYESQLELFIEHLGVKESSNRWKIINSIGCMGKFQFTQNTLECLGYGYITPQQFALNPEIFPEALQRQVLIALFKSNEIMLKDYFYYVGLNVAGVEITKSGLLAAAHLGGAGGVKLFLLSNGQVNKKDLNQTSIRNYLQEFAGYGI